MLFTIKFGFYDKFYIRDIYFLSYIENIKIFLKQSSDNQFLVLLSSICMLYLYSQSYLELVKFNIFWYFYFNTQGKTKSKHSG